MSSTYGFLDNESLPSEDAIISLCRAAGYLARGVTLVDDSSPQSVIAWIKYGPNVTIDEARTQDWTAKALAAAPACDLRVPRVFHAFTRETSAFTIGYIAMEYVSGQDCGQGDVDIVAKAVQTLIGLRGPDFTLGHIGGGSIVHSFFLDFIPIADYKSVQDLHDHVNNILKFMEDERRVDIVADATNGLYLCPCDIHPGNFRMDKDGVLFALDFRATCFMPRSFVAVAMRKSWETFSRVVASKLKYSQSNDVSALLSVSSYLVPFGPNPLAFPPGLKRKQFD